MRLRFSIMFFLLAACSTFADTFGWKYVRSIEEAQGNAAGINEARIFLCDELGGPTTCFIFIRTSTGSDILAKSQLKSILEKAYFAKQSNLQFYVGNASRSREGGTPPFLRVTESDKFGVSVY